MSTSIFDITEDILVAILSKWSDIVDIVRLDTAICCVQRDCFLSLIQGDKMNSFEIENCRADMMMPIYTWCFLRELKFKNILIYGQDSSGLFAIIPPCENYNFTSVTLLSLRPKHITDRLMDFMGSCSHITDLTIHHCYINLFCLVKPVTWQALTTVSFSGLSKDVDTNIFLDILCENCRFLTSLELVTYSLKETSLKALIKSNPSLTEISLSGYGVNQSFVDFLILNCTNMTKLSLHTPSLLSVESLYQLLEKVVSVSASRILFSFVDSVRNCHRFCFNSSNEAECCADYFSDNEQDLESYYKTFVNFDKPYLDCTGNFKPLFDHHFLSPLALLTDLTHVNMVWKFMNNESLLKILQAHKKLVTISIDIGDSQEYPNLLSAPFVDHHSLKVIKIIRKGRSNVWINCFYL
jgi:Leucine-rich repeat (LRR) protein